MPSFSLQQLASLSKVAKVSQMVAYGLPQTSLESRSRRVQGSNQYQIRRKTRQRHFRCKILGYSSEISILPYTYVWEQPCPQATPTFSPLHFAHKIKSLIKEANKSLRENRLDPIAQKKSLRSESLRHNRLGLLKSLRENRLDSIAQKKIDQIRIAQA